MAGWVVRVWLPVARAGAGSCVRESILVVYFIFVYFKRAFSRSSPPRAADLADEMLDEVVAGATERGGTARLGTAEALRPRTGTGRSSVVI